MTHGLDDVAPTLGEFADTYAPHDAMPDLRLAGPASEAVAEQLGNQEVSQPFLATLFWTAFVRSPNFARALGMGMAGRVLDDAARIVVVHGLDDSRYDLLVTGPNFPSKPIVVPAWLHTVHLGEAIARARGVVETFLFMRRGGEKYETHPFARARSLLEEAVEEVGLSADFTLMLAQAPAAEPLMGVPSPAAAVHDAANSLCATIGVIRRQGDGSVLATTALHAVGAATQVYVNGHSGTVRLRDPVTDSCLLRFDTDPFGNERQPYGGASQVRPPRQHIDVEFEGAGSTWLTSTKLRGFDDSILDRQNFLATKIYTDPDANPGDSGAALIDPATNETLGFAAFRSSAGSAMRYSVWVWAEQVYDALGL